MEAAKALGADVADCEMDLFGLNHMVYMKDFFVNGESKFDELIRRVTSDDNDSQTVKNIVN